MLFTSGARALFIMLISRGVIVFVCLVTNGAKDGVERASRPLVISVINDKVNYYD